MVIESFYGVSRSCSKIWRSTGLTSASRKHDGPVQTEESLRSSHLGLQSTGIVQMVLRQDIYHMKTKPMRHHEVQQPL